MILLRTCLSKRAVGKIPPTILPRSNFLAPRASLVTFQKGELFASSKDSQKSIHALPLRQRLPAKSWDTHMHVVEPHRFPIDAGAVYRPSTHTIEEALAFESSLGIENIVLVQPSIYGYDNSCLLEALRHIGPSRGRGVVVVDPLNIDTQTLSEWHLLGVRGVRVNLRSVGKVMDQDELAQTLLQHAEIVRPFGWAIQVYVPLDMIPLLEPIVPQLGVKLCIDHFGGPDLLTTDCKEGISFDPYSLPGFSSLVSLLRAGNTYVKISAPYRLSKDREMRDIEMMAHELLREAPNRVLFATDWPHTRFRGTDIAPFTELCLRVCGKDPELAERVFRRNAEELLDAQTMD
ncbi:hypothetical protein BDV26DRAFT_62542 [Aspergillus bertholletiae]|uniref:Amidohydrolase-related domain-containing protein n=1 Tax=Aspergillus bertholletiae TaxID=1226010 RepID=A0A5N7AW89_9EURO|nr:hypothetical protein BDV26DRAFT_62542 [Aspergillus bertholletiae]